MIDQAMCTIQYVYVKQDANEGAAAGHMGATYDRETGNYEKLEMTSNNFYRNAALGLNSTGNFNGNAVTYEFVPIKINRNTGESNDWNTAGNAAFWSQQGLGAVNYAAKSAAASTPQYGYRGMAQAEASSAKVLGGVAKTTRVLGHGAGVVGVVSAGLQFANSNQTGADYARLGGAALITGTAFIPIAGPFISIGLGALDTYGAFDSFYNSFNSPLNVNKTR